MLNRKELNRRLYKAAEKAGMLEALCTAQVEVHVCFNGEPGEHAYLGWEHELSEDPEFIFPTAAYARAEAWLAKAVTT